MHPSEAYRISKLHKAVLNHVGDNGPVHPQDLEAALDSKCARNGWGGFSKATKRALEKLHHYGHLRIAGRRKGLRLYQRASKLDHDQSPEERFCSIALLIARFHAPVEKKALNRVLNRLSHIVPKLSRRKALLEEVLESNG